MSSRNFHVGGALGDNIPLRWRITNFTEAGAWKRDGGGGGGRWAVFRNRWQHVRNRIAGDPSMEGKRTEWLIFTPKTERVRAAGRVKLCSV